MTHQKVQGVIFDIQRFSVHDGPGIRTSVFLKGCPLACLWCHNPESVEHEPEIAFYNSKCCACGSCAVVCPQKNHRINHESVHTYLRGNCTRCGECARSCVYGALDVAGKVITVGEAFEVIKKDEPFYKSSGGGMTLTGGEPFYQSEFSLALLQHAKESRLHTCVETCGAVSFGIIEKAAMWTDIFLYDIKETSPEKHEIFTGVSNLLILENLEKLDCLGSQIVMRCPIIPGLNDREDHFINLGELANRLKNVGQIHIQPYHPLGVSKAAAIGKISRYDNAALPDRETVEKWAETIRKHTAIPVLISS